MNYIWAPLIEALQAGYDTTKINYRVRDRVFYDSTDYEVVPVSAGAHHTSPLFEYIPRVLHGPGEKIRNEEKFSKIDVNPYDRFTSIFKHILSPERSDQNDVIVCDVMTHILAHIDRICGMSRRDFRILLIIGEIEAGWFGENGGALRLFSVFEKRALAEALIMLYETSNGIRILDALFNMIMTDIDVQIRDNEEIVFYSPYGLDEREEEKLRLIIKLFVPVGIPYVVHSRYTYGTIGREGDVRLEEWVI